MFSIVSFKIMRGGIGVHQKKQVASRPRRRTRRKKARWGMVIW
jgi:hypothetical protein